MFGLFFSHICDFKMSCMLTHARTHARTHTHTHSLSLSPPLSNTLIHIHTHNVENKVVF